MVYIILVLFIVIVMPAVGLGLWLAISALLGVVLGVLPLSRTVNLGKIIFAVRKILIICVTLAWAWEILMLFNSQSAILNYRGYWVGVHISIIIAITITVIRAIQKKPENFDSFKARMHVGMLVTSVLYLAFVSVLL